MSTPEWIRRRTGIATTGPAAERHSARSVLDEASRPHAAEPAADVTFHAAPVAAHLVEVHDYFRADLARVRETLRQVADGAADVGTARGQLAEVTRRANAWALGGLCQGYCQVLAHHHTLESEGIFPHLRRRQADLGAVLDRLHEEHEVIHHLLDDVDAALVALARDPGDLGPITAAVDLLTDSLLSHFAYEEQELVAPLARFGMYAGQV